jgi:hypothetical protein
MEITKTERGFARVDFEDRYGSQCSLQASSLATEAAIWFGVNDGGHFEVRKPDHNHAVHGPPATGGRMHLTQEHVRALLPMLQRFAETGELEGPAPNTDLRERLAALEHDRWSRWERYREGTAGGTHASGEPNEERWRRQRETPYEDLTGPEKESDREEADRTLAIVGPAVAVLRAALTELSACTCGCPTEAHENYGEDGYVCGHEDHECLPCYPAVAEMLARLRHENDEIRIKAERMAALLDRPFPIQGGPSVPWWVMAPHEAQSQRNHEQSLERIAERGGFSPAEAWFVVRGLTWPNSKPEAGRLWRAFAARVNDPREAKDVATILAEIEAPPQQGEPCYPIGSEDLYVIFDGPPSHESGRFVEVEDKDGRSVSAGEWKWREDGYWALGPFRRAPAAEHRRDDQFGAAPPPATHGCTGRVDVLKGSNAVACDNPQCSWQLVLDAPQESDPE